MNDGYSVLQVLTMTIIATRWLIMNVVTVKPFGSIPKTLCIMEIHRVTCVSQFSLLVRGIIRTHNKLDFIQLGLGCFDFV